MSTTIATYVGNGSQTNFNFNFEYLRQEFVKVVVEGVEVPYVFHSSQTIQITPAPLTGDVIIIRRVTDKDRLVTFVDGSVLLAGDLNVAQLQAIHIAAEAYDAASGSLLIDETGAYSAGFRRLTNLGVPSEPNDAVSKEWAEGAMSAQLAQAIAAKDQSVTAKNAAEASQGAAASSASSASTSASTATTKASEASASASAAATSASNASTGATTATTKASEASASATTATTKAAEALASADAAATSAASLTPASKAEAESGTNNTKVMTPLRTKEAIAAQVLGVGQVWQDVAASRVASTAYQNTSGRPIMVYIAITSATARPVQVSVNNVTWVDVGKLQASDQNVRYAEFIVPPNHYYRIDGSATITVWSELR
jgi:hypothetical protein